MRRRKNATIRCRALRVVQDPAHPVYLFALRAEELLQVAEVSRIGRDDVGQLIGYQRPEVRRHVQNIVDYLNQSPGQALFPNSIILALSSGVAFRQVRGPKVDDGLADAGTIEIPTSHNGDHKPAWIVDGQQRALALSRCNDQDFPVPVAAFVADDVDVQREQFFRINSTKPLPLGLVSELLPKVTTHLPATLAARRAPAALCEWLNSDPDSPFHGLIRRASAAKSGKKSIVADTAIIQTIQESLSSPAGCLFPYRNLATGETDFDGVQRVLLLYWNAVKRAFPDAWGLPPSRSRLMHGAGIRSMGKLMDRVMGAVNPNAEGAQKAVTRELARLKPICRWTSGAWEGLGGVRWNELQNVPQHVRMLTNYLVRAHMDAGMGLP